MRKSVPGGEESGVVVLALVVPPSPMAVLLPKKARGSKIVMLLAESLVVSDILRI